ncbi:unnamed protein product [Lactuca virosa]|uniref:Uncharacterized protein n=1 Tax=Lactuca virosa TaxID=75947 RepID=A0AAU9P6K2_9ASTR|nr:unnamed protein product [Lactuca virosa]
MEDQTETKENDGEVNENENDEEKNDEETEETNNDVETSRKMKQIKICWIKFVENIVDNVIGIEFSNLNSQEDEIWNDPEMKTILDNNDIGSTMTGIKTNTPISQVIQGKGKSEDEKEEEEE